MPTTEQKENFWLRASNPAVPKYHHMCHPSTLRQAKLACHHIRLFIKQTYTQVKDVIFLTQRCKENRENKYLEVCMVYYRKTDHSVCSWRVKKRLISGFHHHINDFNSFHLLQDLAWALSMNDRAPQMIYWTHWTTGQDKCIVSHLPLYALLSSLHQKISEIKIVDVHIEQSELGLLMYLANNITEIFHGNWCRQATSYSPYS